ncbi:AAA family ATPase [Nocardioides sp. C4-1]|uniref:AAA family ATPase n=1 Tax=Nocardioides sp. C4-1 TaxID=3151851 RepID=UPI003262EF3D
MSQPRLVLLNGMPGAGKSTLARRYRDDHPGVLCADADDLRTAIGGVPADHDEATQRLVLALAAAHLASGYDVVVPQLVVSPEHLARFEEVALDAGAELVEVVLHGGVVDSRVPDAAVEHLVEYAHGLADLLVHRPGTHRLATRHGDVDAAYGALVDLLDPDLPA